MRGRAPRTLSRWPRVEAASAEGALPLGVDRRLLERSVLPCTASSHPDLVESTRALSVALDHDQLQGMARNNDRVDQASTSIDLVRVINACPSLRHLQIGPLHPHARPALLSALAGTHLASLVAVPKYGRLYQPLDLLVLLLPSLQRLEVQLILTDSDATDPLFPPPLHLPPSQITSLRLVVSLPEQHYHSLITIVGTALAEADIYIEFLDPPDSAKALKAWTTTLASLRRLRIFSNSGHDYQVPWFDQLLPHFKQVERLSLSASNLTPTVLRNLPSSLPHLCLGRRREDVQDRLEGHLSAAAELRLPIPIDYFRYDCEPWEGMDLEEQALVDELEGVLDSRGIRHLVGQGSSTTASDEFWDLNKYVEPASVQRLSLTRLFFSPPPERKDVKREGSTDSEGSG